MAFEKARCRDKPMEEIARERVEVALVDSEAIATRGKTIVFDGRYMGWDVYAPYFTE